MQGTAVRALPRLAAHPRMVGAIAGAALALVSLTALAWLLGLSGAVTITGVQAGFLDLDPVLLGMWGGAAGGAAIAGAICAKRAGCGEAWSGISMGLLTYWLAIPVGLAIVLVVASDPGSSGPAELFLGGLLALPGGAALGAIFLAPLLPVCCLAGIVWARTVRLVAPDSSSASSTMAFPGWSILLVVVLMLAIWLAICIPILQGMGTNSFD